MPTPNADNLRIGVCEVFMGGESLGHTKGGVMLTNELETTDITADKTGSTPLDVVVTGEQWRIRVPLAEEQITALQRAFPTSTEAGGKLTFGRDAGLSLKTKAAALRLHPLRNGTSYSEDWYFHSVVRGGSVELNFEVDNQQVKEVELRALLDEDKSAGAQLGGWGDSVVS